MTLKNHNAKSPASAGTLPGYDSTLSHEENTMNDQSVSTARADNSSQSARPLKHKVLDSINRLDDIRLLNEGAFMAKSAICDLEQRGALGVILAITLEKISQLDQLLQEIRGDLA